MLVRIERRLDPPHDVEFRRAVRKSQEIALERTNAMFGGNRAAKGFDVLIDDSVDVVQIRLGGARNRNGNMGLLSPIWP